MGTTLQLAAGLLQETETQMKLSLVVQGDNDLLSILLDAGVVFDRYDTLGDAVSVAPRSSGILVLADGYPETLTPIDLDALAAAGEKDQRVYVEFPDALPDQAVGGIKGIVWERGVVASDVFPDLEKLRILMIHGCRYVVAQAEDPLIVLARVAGFDRADYGLPEETTPILFEHSYGNLLVATTGLSQVRTGRYAPAEAWMTIWEWILSWLTREEVGSLIWQPTVRPTYLADTCLEPDAEVIAIRRGIAWFRKAKLFVHAEWKAEADRRVVDYADGTGAGPEDTWPVGDGCLGMIEGASSGIHPDGSQNWRYFLRNDCMGETAMAMAFHSRVDGQASSGTIAANLNDFIYFDSDFAGGPRGNPDSPSYGLVRWHNVDADGGIYYGDDNARSALGTMATAALLSESRWDKPLLRCLLANLRTTGPSGFRSGRLSEAGLQEKGWRHYWEDDRTNIAPHYECWLWACFLWAYDRSGFQPFLERPLKAIRTTMDAYPDGWLWTNGFQQERARMLLPLSWLVRIDDTPEHRGWLRAIAADLLAYQDDCGAIREALGSSDHGRYGASKSNAEYGTNEAPLIQENGDPLCDLLYTTNFAFFGLHEAAAATGDPYYGEAEARLADFLCRIQVVSETRPELDGAWFRAFDFRRWDYWASNADSGWGAWSIESGWTQGWITSVLSMRQMGESFWEVTRETNIREHLDALVAQMLPDFSSR
jgi:hypothetical protein